MENTTLMNCKYCGKSLMCVDDILPEEICECASAVGRRRGEAIHQQLLTLAETLCGRGCEKECAVWEAVDESAMEAIAQAIFKVAYGDIKTVTITLNDGSKLKISANTVERTQAVSRQYKI